MVVEVKNLSKEELDRAFAILEAEAKKQNKQKGFNAKKYFGMIKHLNIDGLEFQKQVRDEWE